MNLETFAEAPRLAARMLALEELLFRVVAVAFDDDARARRKASVELRHHDHAEEPETLLQRERVALYEKLLLMLGGAPAEDAEHIGRSGE